MRTSGIARTLESLFTQWQEDLEHAPEFLRDVFVKIVVPLMFSLAATLVCVRVSRIFYRTMFPPSAEQLHKEALGVLKKGNDKGSRRMAKSLLQKSIQKDPKCLASYLSLAALQFYEEESPEESLLTIERGLKNFPKDRELEQMRLDALAMKQNLGHMVKVGAFGAAHIGEEGWRPVDGPNNKTKLRPI